MHNVTGIFAAFPIKDANHVTTDVFLGASRYYCFLIERLASGWKINRAASPAELHYND
jgi:hypothetical protein